jgi:hypothetical protein
MTQERLRELLRERVAEETMPDYSARAWRAARAVRRRRRLGAAAGVAAATVGVSAGIAVLGSTPPDPALSPGVPATSDASDRPDATYRGVPVWWSPDQHEEQELTPVDSPLPPEIDLDASQPYVTGELDRAVAAFARGRSVVLVGPDGQLRTVDVSRLQEVTKPNGYAYFPTGTGMLSMGGTQLLFPQPGGDVATFTIASGEWSSAFLTSCTKCSGPPLPTVGSGEDAPDPGFDASAAQRYGEARDRAASWGMGVPLPVRNASTYLSSPEFLVAHGAVLAFMDLIGDGQDTRYKECCPVAGWLDPQTVVYESRQTDHVLVAWRVRTGDFFLVSRIRGQYDVASFAF